MAEYSQEEIEQAQENYVSVLSQLSNSYRDIIAEQKIIKNTERELTSLNYKINRALKAKQAGLETYINSQGKEVSVARSLNGLLQRRSDEEIIYMNALGSLTKVIEDRMRDEANKMNDEYDKKQLKAAAQFNRISNALSSVEENIKLFSKNVPGVKMLMLGELLMRLGQTLTDFRDRIYKLQAELSTTFNTAISAGASAIYNQIRSFFTGGPILGFQDTIDTINAFQKEFGGILTSDAALRIAQASKDLGVSAEVYLKAQRAFLVVGGDVTRTTFITQFRNAGLTASQALQFAATNANLVAIAGVKYADALARAAANAQRVGVSLDKTEQFADNLVGDFEGALERFSELRAMGVEVDFSRLAQVAATGTPEEVFGELSKEMGGNRALLENIQKNRFLKVAIEKDLGLSIADVTRLAAGGAAKAPEATEAEKQRTLTTTLIERAGFLITGIGGLLSILTLNISALTANTAALLKNASISSLKELFTGGGAAGTLGKVGGVGLGLTGLGVGVGSAMFGRSLAEEGYTKTGIGVGAIGGALAGYLLATALAPFTAGASLAAIPYLASLGAIAGGTYSGMGGKAYGGLITGPGTATSDNIMTPTSPGEFVVNAKATQTYGTDFLNKINSAAYAPEAPAVNNTVNIDMSKLESKLDKLASSFGKLTIQMSGYEVGNVSLNDRSPLFTASPSRVVG